MRPADNAPFYRDYLSLESTNSVKGIFILIVVLNHASSYLQLSGSIFDKSFAYLIGYIGQSMVAPFLFFSGYGIMLSIQKKGRSYVNAIPAKRFLKVLLHFDIAVSIFAVVRLLMGETYPAGTYLLSLTGWESLGNSNWYIFVVLCLYIVTYIAFTVCKNRIGAGFVLTVALSAGLIFLLSRFKQIWWYDTILCYTLGMGYCLGKDRIEALLFRNKVNYYAALALCALLWGGCTFLFSGIAFTIVRHLMFVTALVLFTMKCSIGNPVLRFCGEHLFSIYILQRLPMTLLYHFGITEKYLFVAISLCATVIIAVPFDQLLKKLDGVLFTGKKTAS